jgi:hypothetical protein
MQQENLADIRHKLSIIYKHIQLMNNELRYQAKTYTISEKLKKGETIALAFKQPLESALTYTRHPEGQMNLAKVH